jgi:hypothetical protein
VTYKIPCGKNVGLESALQAMAATEIDLGIFTETKNTHSLPENHQEEKWWWCNVMKHETCGEDEDEPSTTSHNLQQPSHNLQQT